LAKHAKNINSQRKNERRGEEVKEEEKEIHVLESNFTQEGGRDISARGR